MKPKIAYNQNKEADAYLTMAPGISQKYMLEGGWFKHRLGDTMELNQLVYRLVEEANKG